MISRGLGAAPCFTGAAVVDLYHMLTLIKMVVKSWRALSLTLVMIAAESDGCPDAGKPRGCY